eukprot:1949707-Prymnesium_polylepis.2
MGSSTPNRATQEEHATQPHHRYGAASGNSTMGLTYSSGQGHVHVRQVSGVPATGRSLQPKRDCELHTPHDRAC